MDKLCQLHDDALVVRYQKGSNEAFDILLARYKNRLYSYIFCIVRNADLADDLFQETFVKAILAMQQGRYTYSGKFYSWLTRIAHNVVFDQFRAERNDRTISNDESEVDLYSQAVVYEQSLEETMVSEQTLEEVRFLMNNLPANLREVVFMRFYQDMSFKEIAEVTGVSINTALGRMRYALINLRKMMGQRSVF